MRDRAQQEAELGVHDHLVRREDALPPQVIRGDGGRVRRGDGRRVRRGDGKTVAAAAAHHGLGPAGQPGFQQPGRVEQVRDLTQWRRQRRRFRRLDPHLFVEDPPAPLPVAADGLERRLPGAEHIIDPVPVRTADAQPGYLVLGVYSQVRRVPESAESADSRLADLVRDLREPRGGVSPAVQRGLDPRRLAARAVVQQVQHLVADRHIGGRHGLVLRHRRLGLLPRRLPERVEPRGLEPCADALRG
jgi:hypothetical protein